MCRTRHQDANRVQPGSTPTKVRCLVELLRYRATRRKLILLECAIIRHAPFAECGRSIWALLPLQPWFEEKVPPAECIRAFRAAESPEEVDALRSAYLAQATLPLNGHQAIQVLEQHADGAASEDRLVQAEEYFRRAESDAEADRFGYDEARLVGSELRYGVASWLEDLIDFGQDRRNILDYYLANYPGEFHRWAGWLPLHPEHRAVATHLIEEILGHPLRSARLDPSWRTSTTVGLAASMYDSLDFRPMPILADALEEAGCDKAHILNHCRAEALHVRGCWVVDLILAKDR